MPQPHEMRAVVPIFKADWLGYGIDATHDGGTCRIDARNSSVVAGALAAAYVLKKSEMAGEGHIPPKILDVELLQHLRDYPDTMTPVLEILVDELKYTMWRNNEVKGALKQYFNVDSIEVLCVDTKKERKTFAKATKSHPEPGVVAHTFVSALCDLFVVLISVFSAVCRVEVHQTKNSFVTKTRRHNGICARSTMNPYDAVGPPDHE